MFLPHTLRVVAGVSVLLATSLPYAAAVDAASINTLALLNQQLDASASIESASVGFLTKGNYQAVKNELSAAAQPVYYATKAELAAAVLQGKVLAGLVSGTVGVEGVNTFGSEQISVHSMFVRKGEGTLVNAIDHALVRIIERGGVEQIEAKNAPYKALIAHSCMPDSDHFSWPDLQNDTTIRIAALGPYDWGGADGDYTKTPYTGFWPDYYELIAHEFKLQYNITFERVWYKGSAAVLNSIADGTNHASEPYMLVGASYEGVSRKSAFQLSCLTSATQSMYFTKKSVVVEPEGSAGIDEGTLVLTLAILVPLATVLFLLVAVLVLRERKGTPVFKPLADAASQEPEFTDAEKVVVN